MLLLTALMTAALRFGVRGANPRVVAMVFGFVSEVGFGTEGSVPSASPPGFSVVGVGVSGAKAQLMKPLIPADVAESLYLP